ncbi:G-protein coupled receptor moody isoform X1 [Scaptodrosophila lebanonensis]|uniref:G-protein coupled receptor moody isoform X1 n=1 Tax=Drosophila lebanonensis TaxID=7225 RepID=A0A6J2U0Q2_DROLE|nr:G-protein coupled receptor moody isoform X1 [Scaptodrosophila lebanonensis]XP_030381479.1 G-protein coupled receptor moody isoform X1 [Scaptodrosophila lebanonensis]XP_030381480.1 G-protein coupled receptor moody isoform X1 [Scaptodrosophila lebanonensis]
MKDSGEGSGDLGAGYDDSDLIPTADAGDASGFSQSLLTFAAIMTFLIMIVGICGNFLTVVALLKCPKVRNVAAAFIISLCIADLLFCALVLPFQGLRFVQGTWKHGEVLCRLIPFIQYGNIGVSLLCIAMITINRYVMITHHSYYARIYKRHWIAFMIAACWIFSYGMQLPTLLGAWGRFGYDSRLQTCSIMSDRHGHSSKTTLFITAFVIPCLVIIACYAKIFWVVHKSEQRLKRHANNQNSIPNNLRTLPTTPAASAAPSVGEAGISVAPSGNRRVSSDSSSYSTDVPDPQPGAVGKQQTTRVKDQREVRAKRNEWRITKMVLAIFLSFVICYLPITIVKVADKDVEHPSLHIFSYIMLYLSACINPIIYVIMNKQYRKAYKTVVLCKPSQLLLPFGKANGASSAAEKWKDTGLSNNHSRTLVSQMSACMMTAGSSGAATTGPTPTLCPSISLELMARRQDESPIPPSSAIAATPQPPPPSVTTAATPSTQNQSKNSTSSRLALKKNNHSYINNGFNSNSNSSSTSPNSANNSLYRPGSGTLMQSNGNLPLRRITMVGDDIILEEEELPTTPSPTSTATPDNGITSAPAASAPAPAPAPTTPPIYMNVAIPKKSQYYSKTIDDTPVNDALQQRPDTAEGEVSKVPTKLKIQKTNKML